MYWHIILVIITGLFVAYNIKLERDKVNIITIKTGQMILLTTMVVAILVLTLSIIFTQIEIYTFSVKFEYQRQLYVDNSFFPSRGAEILMINDKLYEYQSSKMAWGNWSLIPSSILNIEPIK